MSNVGPRVTCAYFVVLAQDAGLENMALEVGTVRGGQIAALQDGKEGGLGKPLLCIVESGVILLYCTASRGNPCSMSRGSFLFV